MATRPIITTPEQKAEEVQKFLASCITIEDIQRATQLGTRAVRAWIQRLSIVPAGVRGRVHIYPPRVVSDIQAAQIQQSMARRKGGSLTVTLEAAAAATGHTIITLDEAKRRAKGRTP